MGYDEDMIRHNVNDIMWCDRIGYDVIWYDTILQIIVMGYTCKQMQRYLTTILNGF